MSNTFVVEAVRASLGEAYLVGGAVRDTLIGDVDKIKDYDFATPLPIEDTIKRLEENNYKVIKNSVKYGTVSAIIGKTKVEISTFRADKYDDTIRAAPSSVEFDVGLEEDLSRRDFTINAIAHDGENYIDPFHGQSDIVDEKIRAVGNPVKRFEEDPLRMLRAVRFVSQLGFTLSSDTYDAIVGSSPMINDVSRERITEEFTKILCGENWVRAISLILETGLLDRVLNIQMSEQFVDEFLNSLTKSSNASDTPLSRWIEFIKCFLAAWAKNNAFKNFHHIFYDFFNMFRERFDWSKSFEQTLYDKLSSYVNDEDQTNLERQYEQLVHDNDPRQFVVKERILRIKIRQAINGRNLKQVSKMSLELINVENHNLQIRLEKSSDKSEVIKEFKDYMLEAVRFLYLEIVVENGRIDSKKELNTAFEEMLSRKDTFDLLIIEIGKNDRMRIIEESMINANRILGGRVTSLSNAEIQDLNIHFERNNQRLTYIRRAYIRELVELRKPPYDDDVITKRAKYNFLASRIIAELEGEETLQYYSHLIDYYKWKSMTTANTVDFMQVYEQMNIAMDKIYLNPSLRDNYNEDSQYLDNAKCLTFATTLTTDIDEKISLIRNIVANYSLVTLKSKRNASRYQLLLDWLTYGKKLLSSNYLVSEEILLRLPSLKSYHYEDSDEDYIKVALPEIDRVRTNFYDLEAFLCRLNNIPTDLEIKNSTLKAINALWRDSIIDGDLSFAIFRNYLSSLINESVPLEPISLLQDTNSAAMVEDTNETLEIIKNGENERIEFKQSWRFDTKKNAPDPTGGVLDSAIRAIVSFMNTSGGTLYLGVKDDGSIVGLEESEFRMFKKEKSQLGRQDALRKLIDDQLSRTIGQPSAVLKTISFEVIDGKTICIIDVQQSTIDVYYKDKYYIRHSGSTRELNTREYSEYKAMRSNA